MDVEEYYDNQKNINSADTNSCIFSSAEEAMLTYYSSPVPNTDDQRENTAFLFFFLIGDNKADITAFSR